MSDCMNKLLSLCWDSVFWNNYWPDFYKFTKTCILGENGCTSSYFEKKNLLKVNPYFPKRFSVYLLNTGLWVPSGDPIKKRTKLQTSTLQSIFWHKNDAIRDRFRGWSWTAFGGKGMFLPYFLRSLPSLNGMTAFIEYSTERCR